MAAAPPIDPRVEPALSRLRRRADAVALLRLLAGSVSALVVATQPPRAGGVSTALAVAVDLGIALSALPAWLASRRARDERALRRAAWATGLADLALYAVLAAWLQDVVGLGGLLGLLALFDLPVRLGRLGAVVAGGGVGAIALTFPQVQASGTTQPTSTTVVLCVALPAATALVAGLLQRNARRLDDADALLRAAFDHAAGGLALVAADGTVQLANKTLRTMLSGPRSGPVDPIGRGMADLLTGDGVPSSRARRADLERQLADVASGRGGPLSLSTQVGDRVLVVTAARVEGDGDERRPVLLELHDITDQRRLEAELAHQATHDALTGLSNRRLMTERLGALLDAGVAAPVVFLDLDSFKAVNDDHGHGVGDRVLVIVAERLRAATRPTDVVGRLSGDEFLVLCPGAGPDVVAAVAARVEAAVGQPMELGLGRGPLRVGASVGLCIPAAGDTPVTVIARADQAMYTAKRRRRRASEAARSITA